MLTIIIIVDLLCHILYNGIYILYSFCAGKYLLYYVRSLHFTIRLCIICSNCHLIYMPYKILYGMKNVSHGWKMLKQFFYLFCIIQKKTNHWWSGLTQFTVYSYCHNIFSILNYGTLDY